VLQPDGQHDSSVVPLRQHAPQGGTVHQRGPQYGVKVGCGIGQGAVQQ
jgi:hypothetical protein